MSTIYLNWLHNKLDTTGVKLIEQISGGNPRANWKKLNEGGKTLCYMLTLGSGLK